MHTDTRENERPSICDDCLTPDECDTTPEACGKAAAEAAADDAIKARKERELL